MADINTLGDYIAFCIWLIVALSSMIANGCAIFLLQKSRTKNIADLLVLQLTVVELIAVAWNVMLRPLQWFAHKRHVGMIRSIGNQFLAPLIYQSITFISLDRLLAAALSIKYRQVVTKRRLTFAALLNWVLAIICAIICGIYPSLNSIGILFLHNNLIIQAKTKVQEK